MGRTGKVEQDFCFKREGIEWNIKMVFVKDFCLFNFHVKISRLSDVEAFLFIQHVLIMLEADKKEIGQEIT